MTHMDESTLFSCSINDGDDAVDAPGVHYGDGLSPYDLQWHTLYSTYHVRMAS